MEWKGDDYVGPTLAPNGSPQQHYCPREAQEDVTVIYWRKRLRQHDWRPFMLPDMDREPPVGLDSLRIKMCGVLQNEGYLRGWSSKDLFYRLKTKLILPTNKYLAWILMVYFHNCFNSLKNDITLVHLYSLQLSLCWLCFTYTLF